MKAETSLKVSCSLYDFGTGTSNPHPRDITVPDSVINQAWIAQTIMDTIWLLWEFESEDARNTFLDNIPEELEKAMIGIRKQYFFDHWVDGKISHESELY